MNRATGSTDSTAHRPTGRLRPVALGAVVLALAAATITGCGNQAHSGSNQIGVAEPASAAPGPAGAAQRYTVAQESEEDLAAALSGNGVGDPDKWAKIVLYGQPYPTGPDGQAKLRQVLLRYQASPDDTAKITNALVP